MNILILFSLNEYILDNWYIYINDYLTSNSDDFFEY